MTLAFSHSLHPTTSVKPREPHRLPNFDSPSSFATPVLYLPPLLSPLPDRYSVAHPPLNPSFSPLIIETRLPDIDPASLSLHKALHYFKPLSPDYANTAYGQAFNWSELRLPKDEGREWYCVAFRSKRKAGSDGTSLYDADRLAHEEAIRNGGLILYWYGLPNPETGMNLATCIWQSRKHATAANSRPHHIQAMRLAAQVYDAYSLERYVLRKIQGEEGVTIETFTGDEVGW